MGETVKLDAIIGNDGDVSSKAVVRLLSGNKTIAEQEDVFYVGQDKLITFSFKADVEMKKLKVVVDPDNVVKETNENDNAKEIDISVKPITDIVVKGVSIDKPYAKSGETVNVKVTLQNAGKFDTNEFKVGVFCGKCDAVKLLSNTSVSLKAGETKDVTIPTVVHSDVQYLTVLADYENEVVEPYETNNYASIGILVFKQPDLVAKSLVVTPEKPTYGMDAGITAVVENTGEINTTAEVEIVKVVDGKEVTVLKESRMLEVGKAITLNAKTTADFEKVILRVDPKNVVDEINEDNNEIVKEIVAEKLPDLALTDMNIDVMNPRPGDVVVVTAKVKNVGYGASKDTVVRFYKNSVMPSRYLGEVKLKALNVNEVEDVSLNVVVTRDMDRIIAIVNPDRTFNEYRYDNNQLGLKITPLLLPDLMVEKAWLSKSNPVEDESVKLTYVIRNVGEKPANVKVNTYYNEVKDENLIDSRYVFVDGKKVENVMFTAKAGMNKIIVVVDPDNKVMELNENNNMAEVPMKVILHYDLVAEEIKLSNPTPIEGEKVKVFAKVCNRGVADATNVYVVFYWSPEEIKTIEQAEKYTNKKEYEIHREPVGVLKAGDCINITFDWIAKKDVKSIIVYAKGKNDLT
jgi:subtilase family serine protease